MHIVYTIHLFVVGVVQLTDLDHNIVAKLCCQLFPQWLQSLDELEFACLEHLPEQWITEFWQYLARWFADNLSTFEGLHLLPDGNGRLLRLDRSKAVIVFGYNDTLPGPVIDICRRLGIRVIERMLLSICSRCDVWGRYFLRPDVEGVLTALSRLDVKEVMRSFLSLSFNDKKLFRTYILPLIVAKPEAEVLCTEHKILRVLPIFETLPVISKDNATDGEHQMVSLTEVSVAGAVPLLPVMYPELILDANDPLLQQFLREMKIEILSISNCLTRFVFPAVNNDLYSIQQVESLMKFVCDQWPALSRDAFFVSSVREVIFVAHESGDLVIPSDLFDGDDPVLRILFRGQDVFPVGIFASQYADVLRAAGLKGQESVTALDIYRVIQILDECSSADVKTAETIVNFLEQHSKLLIDEVLCLGCSLVEALKRHAWVPFMKCRPSQYPHALRFCGEHNAIVLCTPDDVTSAKNCHLVGSVKCIFDTAHIPKLSRIFLWNEDPSTGNVIAHLLNVSSDYVPNETAEFTLILRSVYNYLNRQEESMNELCRMLKNEKWIFHGCGFADVKHVVRQKPFTDFTPHVYVLYYEFLQFENLWNSVGVKDECSLLHVINSIATVHDGQEQPADTVNRDLKLAIDILDEVAGFGDDALLEIRNDLVVPVDRGENILHMKPIAECTYCDPKWYSKEYGGNDDINFIHRRISTNTAIRLNIRSFVSRTLNAEELDIGMTAYGQSEELTTRLKTLLEREYTDGLTVIKELLQNADDAVASEVKLLYDERENSHAKLKLLDPGMKSLQGPALWVFNDATFRDQDFDNLVKLNAATKQHCTDKVGQFGLGFNAVYNLTDVPALISRNYLVYLDPHTTYLGEAIRDKPGIKLNLEANCKWLSYFSDQFEPFNGIFGCQLTGENAVTDYKGTLFRFPLRTEEQSKGSKLSNKHYSRDEMISLLNMFSEAADYLLLFTQNVTKVSVFHLSSESESPQDMYELFSVTKSMERVVRSPGSEQERPFAVLEFSSSLMKENKVSIGSAVEFSFLLKMSVEYQEDILNVFGFEHHSKITYWLISMCLGREKSMSISLEKQDRIPLGGVAARLEKLENHDFTAVSVSCGTSSFNGGIVFCFLPLPLTAASGLPIHINGYFAIDSNRKHLVMKAADQKSNDDAIWNEHLITDAVKLSYEILLEDVLKLCPHSDSFSIWPEYSAFAKDGIISQLVDRLYYDISDDCGPVICRVNNRCVSLRMCKMLDVEFRGSAVGEKAQRVFEQVKSPDFEVLDLPVAVLQSLLLTSARDNVRDQIVSKTEFYEKWFLPNITRADRALRDQLVISALFDDDIRMLLQYVDCIPVRPNGILRNPSDLIDPTSALAILYDEEDSRFPLIKEEYMQGHGAPDVFSKLVSIGMQHDKLSWKELAGRCSVVTQKRELVSERLNLLIQLMNSSVDSIFPEDETFINEIRGQRFLPVKSKEQGFLLPWKGDEVEQYTSCNEAYLADSISLVCCSYPIVHEAGLEKNLKEKLQLTKPVSQQTVLHQLDCIICRLCDNKKQKERTVHVPKVREFCTDIYRYFEKLLKDQDCPKVVQELLKRQCILTETKDVFMYPEHCARDIPVGSDDLLPYLYATPYSMSRLYNTFLEAVGVKKTFGADDYVGILRRMKDEHSNKPLSNDDLKVAIAIINNCLPECSESELLDTSDVYVPNTAAVLCTVDTVCMHKNCDWINRDDVDGHICHDKISPAGARKLGIRTIRQEYLIQNSDEFGLPFGQEEDLTTRLHNIIRDYRCDETVLKEMLQNADDAGATQLHLINDRRTLPDRQVFDDSWKPLQGPALCVYNNKPFTNDDLRGIQKLGKGSKHHDATNTGQYGVGFNCVYHLTDVPTFLTSVNGEQVLCVFDPHRSYISGASKERPGRLLKNLEQLKSRFPDVFQGYLLTDYDENCGSLFRLPLRNADMSRNSKIATNIATSDTVHELFTVFQQNMYKSLLFLNCVEEISLRTIHAGSANGASKVNFSVTAKMSQEARRERESFMNAVKRVAKELESETQVLEQVHTLERVCYELTTEDNEGNVDLWLIVQSLGFDCLHDSDSICISSLYTSGHIDLLPRAGVAHLTSGSRGSVCENQLFCFLPLTDAKLDIPVNVNGHFFLNCEARQNLWAERNADRKSEWNLQMMKNAVAPAYCTLIERRRHETENLLQNLDQLDQMPSLSYFSVFPPMPDKEDSYVSVLCKSVYRRLQDAAVIPVYSFSSNQFTWFKPANHSIHDGFFDNIRLQLSPSGNSDQQNRPSDRKEKQVANIYQIVRNILLRSGLKLFYCPLYICTNFEFAGVSVKVLQPEDVVEFFRTYDTDGTSCLVQEIEKPIAETLFKDVTTVVNLLKYCVLADDYKRLLIGTPLLVTSDNHLRLFEESRVRYEPCFADILPHIPEQFVHKSIFHALELDATSDTHLCKKLTISKFVEELPYVVPPAIFFGADKRVCIDEISGYLPATARWIRQVWKFFHSSPSSDEVLYQLSDWCILPAMHNDKGILVPIRCARSVIAFTTTVFASYLDKALGRIGVMRPSNVLLEKHKTFDFYLRCLGSTERPATVIAALQSVFKVDGCFNCKLTSEDASVLLKYFTDNISVVSVEATNIIRQLPIFETCYHNMVSIGNAQAYVIRCKIPPTEVENICVCEGIMLLKSSDTFEPLLRRLRCNNMHEVTFYCDYVFKRFQMLSNHGRMAHLQYIKNVLLPELENGNDSHLQTLLSCLKKLAFIPRATDDTLATASEFYDPSVELLRFMHEEMEFPPDEYKNEDWTKFLRKCGLVYKVSPSMFLRYSTQLASSAEITDRVQTQSKELLKHLFSHKKLLHQTAFIQELRAVKFIVPHCVGSVRETYCTQYGERSSDGGLSLVQFANSISSEWADAVWSAQNIVPQSVFQHMKTSGCEDLICSELQFHRTPMLPNVVKHTKQLCKKLVPMMKQKISAAELRDYSIPILHTIYRVLSTFTHFSEFSRPENARTTLSKTSFVIDAARKLLVRPNQLVLQLTEENEIVPYLISMPRDIRAYEHLFCKLGACNFPSSDQYVMVLEMIHIDSQDEVMHPDERRKAKKAMYGLFCLLQSSGDEVAINGELYLPGGKAEEWKMYQASALMFDDARLSHRLNSFEEPFMLSLRECDIHTKNDLPKDLVKRLPVANRPMFLSQVVKEIAEIGNRVADCPVAQHLSEKFSSEDFRDALIRIALYSLCKTPTEEDEQRAKNAVEGLQAISVVGVDNLSTYLMYNGNRIQDSDCEKPYHVHREDTESCRSTIFVRGDAVTSPTLSEELTEVVNYVTGHIVKFDRFLLKIIECEAGAENRYLDEKDIPLYGTRQCNAASVSFMPALGSFVPLIYHRLLRPDVQLLYPGDFAAMETDDPVENGEPGLPTYILVQVVRMVEDAENDEVSAAALHYKVLVGPNQEITVSALVLYAFTRDHEEVEQTSDLSMEPCAHAQPSGTSAEPQAPVDYDTIVKGLRKQLKDAWRMPEADRKKFVKRLLLRWHPDKNLDNPSLATKVTQFILEAFDRLERGLSIDDENTTADRRHGWSGGQSWSAGTGNSYGGFHRTFYEHMNQRARQHQQQYQHFAGHNYHRGHRHYGRGGFFAQFRTYPNPQPGEARRWLRQAKADIDAAMNDEGCGRCCAFEWACYKYYQVGLYLSWNRLLAFRLKQFYIHRIIIS